MHIKDHSAAMKFFRTYDNVASKGKWKEFVDEMEFDSMIQEPRPMAQGGRTGYGDGPPGTIKKATGPTKKNTGSTSPVKTDTHIYKRTNKWGTVWSDTKSKTAEGWVKRKAHALDPKNIDDIRANLIKNKKKVTMVNNQFIFADEKLEKEFIDDMILRYTYPKTSTAAKNAGVKSNAQIFETYFKGTYSEKGVHDLINRFKKTLGDDFSRLHPSEKDAHKLRRQVKELITQAGKRISGLDDFPAHHLYPIGDEFAHGTQDFTILDKKTNSQLSGSNKQLIGLSEQRTQLVNDVSSGKISSKNFDIEMGKLDNQAQTIIDGHYKKFPQHDGLLNWRKATSVLDDQGRFMDIQSTGSIGGDSSKWAITDVNKQIKDLSKTELSTFRSDVKNTALERQLIKLCPKGNASGGRIGFANPAGLVDDGVRCGMNQLTKYLTKTGVPEAERTLVSRILGMGKGLIKGAGQILNPLELFKLRNWVSPQALAAFGLFETAFVADDVLRNGKPLNEAVAGNWLTNIGGFLDEEVEKAKNILGSNKYQLSPAAKQYAQSLIDIKNYNDLDNYEKVYGMAGATHTITPEIREKVESDKKTLYDKIMKTPSTGQLDYENISGEKEATWKGKAEDAPFFGYDSFTSGQTKKQIVPGEYIQKKGQLPEPKITDVPDYYVSENYQTSYTPTNELINKYLQSIGKRPLKSGEGTLIRMQQPGAGLYGTQDKFATGGIASLKKKW